MEFKGTKGEWKIDYDSSPNGLIKKHKALAICTTNEEWSVAAVWKDLPDEYEANAKLIAEAGTVTNECGFTPRQLLDQRNEFLDLVMEARLQLVYLNDRFGETGTTNGVLSNIGRAIEKALK